MEFVGYAIVGAATSRPQRNGTARLVEWHAIRTHCRGGSQPPAFVPGQKCSVEWYHVRHSTNSPKLIRDCRFIPRGRLRASPTVLSWCCGNSPNPVHHFWLVLRGRLVAAPTMAGQLFRSGAQKRYRAQPRSPGFHTSPVRHCPRALPAKLQFSGMLSKTDKHDINMPRRPESVPEEQWRKNHA